MKYFNVLFALYFFAPQLFSAGVSGISLVPHPYESFRTAGPKKFFKMLNVLEQYLEDPRNIEHCEKLGAGEAGVNLTYKVRYQNGLEGILKYPSYEKLHESERFQDPEDIEKVKREVAAYTIAKEVGERSVAPIVEMTYAGGVCPDVSAGATVSVSYFIKDADHITTANKPTDFAKEQKKYDLFNFLVFDCDHATHNILKKRAGLGESYLFDYDWAFSYPKEIEEGVHSQSGFESWCSDYIALQPAAKDTKRVTTLRSKEICKRFPNVSAKPRFLSKLKKYARGLLPKIFKQLDAKRKNAFLARVKLLEQSAESCPAEPKRRARR